MQYSDKGSAVELENGTGKRLAHPRVVLLLILLLACALRVYGIHWGLPSPASEIASYHPDEVPTMLQAEMMGQGAFRPQQFVYGGSLYFHMVRSFLMMGDLFAPQLDQYNFTANGLLAGRYFMVAVALLTLLLLYESVRSVRGEKTALLATFMLAITPLHVVTAQQVRPDEIGALFVVLQFFFAVKVLQAATDKMARALVWAAALAAGAMLAFRFPLVLFFAMPMLAWLLRAHDGFWRNVLPRLLPTVLPVSWVLIAAGYTLSSPETFTHFGIFKAGMALQWQFQSSPFADAVGQGPVAWQYWWGMLHQALGYPFYFITVAALALAAYRRQPLDWILLIGLVPYAVMVSISTWVVVRYTLPLVPLLVIIAADGVQWAAVRYGVKPVTAIVSAGSALTLWATLAFLHMEASPNVRELTRSWIAANIPADQCLLMVKAYEAEEMYNPFFGRDRCNGTIQLDRNDNDYGKVFTDAQISYVVMHQHMYASMERLGDKHPEPKHSGFYAAMLASGFAVLHEEKVEPELFGLNFAPWFSSLDLTYVNPAFRIYHRQQ